MSDGHEEERGMGMPVIYTIVGVSAVILLILAVVFLAIVREIQAPKTEPMRWRHRPLRPRKTCSRRKGKKMGI